jgi:hypothetical protein
MAKSNRTKSPATKSSRSTDTKKGKAPVTKPVLGLKKFVDRFPEEVFNDLRVHHHLFKDRSELSNADLVEWVETLSRNYGDEDGQARFIKEFIERVRWEIVQTRLETHGEKADSLLKSKVKDYKGGNTIGRQDALATLIAESGTDTDKTYDEFLSQLK